MILTIGVKFHERKFRAPAHNHILTALLSIPAPRIEKQRHLALSSDQLTHKLSFLKL